MTCRQGRTKDLYSLNLTCFTVFSSKSFFALVLIRAFQTLFISHSFCLNSPKAWRLQQWALPVAAAECSRGFCPCFQKETATVVSVPLVRCHSSQPAAYPALCITWKLWPLCFYVRSWTAVLRDQYTQTSCCYYQKSRNSRQRVKG